MLELIPVPLASNFELTYIARCAVPDTDMFWNSLIGLDLKKFRFKFYSGNRLKPKPQANKTAQDCIFNNNYYALTSEWLKELGIGYFEWIEEVNSAKVVWNNDTLYIRQGGCHHFGQSLELRMYRNDLTLDSLNYLKKVSGDLADDFGFKHYAEALQSGKYEIMSETNTGFWLNIEDDDIADNVFYNGVQVSMKDDMTTLSISKYVN